MTAPQPPVPPPPPDDPSRVRRPEPPVELARTAPAEPADGRARGPLVDPRVANPLDLESMPDDRALLGLPASGALTSGQIEAALAARMRDIRAHPLGSGHKAQRVALLIEDAADRLQAELALAGRGPLHPAAAARAARRLAAERDRDRPRGVVVSPTEGARRTQGVSAEDLTEFDRLALAVLVVSRGWNATSAKRLASVAADFGVEVDELERVVTGLTRFLAEGGSLHGRLGEVGADARASMLSAATRTRTDRIEGAVERAFSRIDEALREQMHDDSRGSQAKLAVVFGLFALSWIGLLAYVFFAPSDSGEVADELAGSAVPALAAEAPAAPVAAPVNANGEAIAPPPLLAAPAKFPRPPGFTPTETPKAILESASGGAAWIGDLEGVARALATNRGRLEGRNLQIVTDALSAAADAWPAAPVVRGELLRVFGEVSRTAKGSESLRNAMQAVPGSDADLAPRTGAEWTRFWRRSFGAGVLASIALDSSQPFETLEAAREEMRRRQIAIPRGEVADPFAVAATAELSASAARLAERLALGTSELEDASRWAEALGAAATTPALRRQAIVSAIDAALRAPGALDKPGALVDFLGFALHELDFSGRGEDSEAVRNTLAAWLVDRAIPSTRLWVLTSLLDADLGIAWYGPDLVLATDAAQGERERLSERMLAAFPKVERTAVGESIAVDREALAEWTRQVAALESALDVAEYQRLRNAAVALRLARAARAFETADLAESARASKSAESLAAREAGEWMASPTGDRFGSETSGVGDGEFADAYAALGRDTARRVDLLRSLGARPASGDLGPVDARVVVGEALRGSPQDVRAAAATVLVDRYARGREVLRATLDLLADGTSSSDAPDFVSRLVGAQVAGADWQSEARDRILETMLALQDHELHAVDLASLELAAAAVDLATGFDRTGAATAAANASRADRALAALADAMRADAASRFLAAPFPEPVDEIERLRLARRSVAQGATQRMAAETPAIVSYGAMLVAARQPALESRLVEILARGRKARASAASATAQVESDLETLLEVLATGFVAKATERDAKEGGST